MTPSPRRSPSGNLPPVGALANIAGITSPVPFLETTLELWNKVMAVNATGTYLVTKAFLPDMIEQGWGRIVNMSSVSAQRGGGVFGKVPYSSAKAAILGFTKALAREIADTGVTVNAVTPGAVDTNIRVGTTTSRKPSWPPTSRSAASPPPRRSPPSSPSCPAKTPAISPEPPLTSTAAATFTDSEPLDAQGVKSGYPTTVPYPDIDPTGLQWERRTYFDVLNELLDFAGGGSRPAVVAIDGHTGSGKSTLARGLAALEPRCVVIHTDELAQRSFDWADHLVDRILLPIRQGSLPISHRNDSADAITISADTPVVFIEGVGSARRETRPWLDAVVWVHTREAVGRRQATGQAAGTGRYTDDWLVEENALLADHRPWQTADVLVSGELGQPAHDGRYGNVVTAAGPARVVKES